MDLETVAYGKLCAVLNKHLSEEGFPPMFGPAGKSPNFTGLMLVAWLSADWRKTTEELSEVREAVVSMLQQEAA